MEIIGFDKEKARKVTCKHCGAILLYSDSEKRTKAINCDYLGDCDYVSVITCMSCKDDVRV